MPFLMLLPSPTRSLVLVHTVSCPRSSGIIFLLPLELPLSRFPLWFRLAKWIFSAFFSNVLHFTFKLNRYLLWVQNARLTFCILSTFQRCYFIFFFLTIRSLKSSLSLPCIHSVSFPFYITCSQQFNYDVLSVVFFFFF